LYYSTNVLLPYIFPIQWRSGRVVKSGELIGCEDMDLENRINELKLVQAVEI